MLSIIGMAPPFLTRLGYASPAADRRFIVYGERALPADRRSRLQRNSAFSDLDYAVYLGRSVRPGNLLVASGRIPPLHGERASTKFPFGNNFLTLVVSPRVSLAGTLPQRLPWIIAIVGAILTLGATAFTVRLVQRRRSAEQVAGRLDRALSENQRLYAEQRTIAQTLQHALLPEQMPAIAGAQASARFEPGERGVDIGGDWYDVIPLDEQRLLVVVGDVSGRGLRAAATMASLRYAIHAYAAQNDPPAAILTKLSRILSVTDERAHRDRAVRAGRPRGTAGHDRQRRPSAPVADRRRPRRIPQARDRAADRRADRRGVQVNDGSGAAIRDAAGVHRRADRASRRGPRPGPRATPGGRYRQPLDLPDLLEKP